MESRNGEPAAHLSTNSTNISVTNVTNNNQEEEDALPISASKAAGDKRLLDWRLDFVNAEYARKYNLEYNAEQLKIERISFMIGVALGFLPVIVGYMLNDKVFYYPSYGVLLTTAPLCLITMLLLLFVPGAQRNAGIVSIVAYAVISIGTRITHILAPNDSSAGPGVAEVPFTMILQALVLRLKFKHITISFVFMNSFYAFSIMILPNTNLEKLGFVLPTLFFFVFSLYCGYFFEKRWKYGFLRRQLVDAEAAKLSWVCARDASLLRNIFPKNLSDELELQLAKCYVRTTATTGYSIPSTPRTPRTSVPPTPNRTPRDGASSHESPRNSPLTSGSSSPTSSVPSPPTTPTAAIIRVISNTAMRLQNLAALNPYHAAPTEEGPPQVVVSSSSFSSSPRKEEFPALSISIPALSISIPEDSSPPRPSLPTSTTSPIIYLPEIVPTPRLATSLIPIALPSSSITPRPSYNPLPTTPQVLLPTSSGLKTPTHQPELHTFLNAAQTSDGSQIALSHFYPKVIVIFADIVGFTSLSSSISPQELVALLNRLFRKFDDIMDFHNLEKIRTVGDAYLCVGNMSVPLEYPEIEAVNAAQKMISEVHKIKDTLSLRVGIASGPLIAGVTGITKWNYDIFGKPLSQANLMETLAPPNHISVTEAIYLACKSQYHFFPGSMNGDGHDPGHSNAEFFLLKGEISRFESTESLAEDDSLALLALSAPSSDQDEQLGKAMADILEYADAQKEIAEITETYLTADPAKLLGYTREDIDKEERHIENWWMTFSFRNRDFEREFFNKTTETIHKYTSNLAVLFVLSIFVYVFVDILEPVLDIDRPKNPVISSTTVITICVWLILYAVLVRIFDLRRGGTVLSALTVNIYLYALIIVFDQYPTGYNLNWVLLSIIAVSSCIRLPAWLLMGSQLIFVLVAIIIVRARLQHYFLDSAPSFFVYLAISFYSQRNFQQNLREQFLAIKTLRLDMYHQKISQHRANLLIRNILPEDIIPRLRSSESSNSCVVKLFEHATMIFINITNLSSLTESLDPANTFQIYNEIFTLFDEVTRAFRLEKIKTINTVYMVASGLPKQIPNHVDVAVQFASEINRVISKYSYPRFVREKFLVRIGIASGPVVAGIIGKTKYAYDCWSDTTNTASRMESNGWDGYLQMTATSFDMLQNKNLPFERRENVTIKGKGHMDTYVLRL